MANGQLKRILGRRAEVDEAEFELLQSRVLARLHVASAADIASEPDAVVAAPEPTVGVMAEPESESWREPVPVMAATEEVAHRPDVIETDAVDEDDPIGLATDVVEAEPVTEIEPVAEFQAPPEYEAPLEAKAPPENEAPPEFEVPPETELPPDAAVIVAVSHVDAESAVATVAAPGRRRTTSAPRKRPLSPRATPPPAPAPKPRPVTSSAGPAPYCPYCALLLDPPPETSRRCPRCRERIVVKRVDGRAIYLTEASVAIFDAERRRLANSGRWTKERARWLKAAASVDAPAQKIARLEKAPLSDEVVASSRSLYFTTVDRAFRAAKRERRWEDASEIMRAHALVLFKLAGSPVPPPDDSLDAHRQAAAAVLRGLGEMSRVVELVSSRCCDTCRADDGGLFKVATELRQPRLPHAGCPKGLCRCDWFLAVRDQSLVRRQLRRRARSEAVRTGS